MNNVLIFIVQFFLWTLLVYLIHRAAHYRSKYNFLLKIHLQHHRINYLNKNNRVFKWYYIFFYFGSVKATVDVVLTLTLPAVFVYLMHPPTGVYILIIHYLYEVFLSEGLLDHNPAIRGKLTKVFSWGEYHLKHHKNPKCNFGLIITLWDKVFRTAK